MSTCLHACDGRLGSYLSTSAHKRTEDIFVRWKPEHIPMNVFPACLLSIIKHCRITSTSAWIDPAASAMQIDGDNIASLGISSYGSRIASRAEAANQICFCCSHCKHMQSASQQHHKPRPTTNSVQIFHHLAITSPKGSICGFATLCIVRVTTDHKSTWA